jgi:Zn-dependent peptidase ImmA (M78 family)
VDEVIRKFPRWRDWLGPSSPGPTARQLEEFSKFTGIPFGYLLLRQPPALKLPIADFREGYTDGWDDPSPELLAVLNQSIRRQEWYRAYALDVGLPPVDVVGSVDGKSVVAVAEDMRERLSFTVPSRTGSWADTRKHLIQAFEELGGLTVTTSMVENNTHRALNPDEFRGFSLVDELAPLVFVNAAQTLNGQIFTFAHEFAHVWRGTGGISAEDIRRQPANELEIWCNAVASEFLVPETDLVRRYPALAGLELVDRLERLAGIYKCGTLVLLQAIRRAGLETFQDFDGVYSQEMQRLATIQSTRASGGGDHYLNQPYRIGTRLSRAVIGDAIEGRTPLNEALGLMSMRSLRNFDEYARRLGVA